MNIHKTIISKGLLFRLILMFCAIYLLFIAFGCDPNDSPEPSETFAPNECGKVDSVKSAIKGEISAYIVNQTNDASYILVINSKKYVGNTNQSTPWTFFTGLPSGTYDCTWFVSSSCTGEAGEYRIHGPDQVTIK